MNKMKTAIGILLLVVALGTVQINTYALHEQNQTAQSQSITPNRPDQNAPLVFSVPADHNENETTTTMTAEAWKTCEDPILQISIECPTNWSMIINEDVFMFEPADVPGETRVINIPRISVEIENVFPIDTPDDYMRQVVNEDRGSDTQIIGLNETTVNERPAYRAHYNDEYVTTLQYFLIDISDYTGYTLEYEVGNDVFAKYLLIFERMANSFEITK
jgi:hypothetical protein